MEILNFKVMKRITSFSILMVAILLSNVSYATGNFSVSLTPKNENVAVLNVTNDLEQIYLVNISDSDGNMIYSYKTKDLESNFSQTLDFSKLEEGFYEMNVKADDAEYVKYLSVDRSGVSVEKSIKKTKPVFQVRDNVIKVSYLNHGKEKTSVHVFQNGSLIWDKELENDFALTGAFDISNLDSGNYDFVLVSGDNIFEYQLSR